MIHITGLPQVDTYMTIFIAILLSLLLTFYDQLQLVYHPIWFVIVALMLAISIFVLMDECPGVVILVGLIFLHSYRNAFGHLKFGNFLITKKGKTANAVTAEKV